MLKNKGSNSAAPDRNPPRRELVGLLEFTGTASVPQRPEGTSEILFFPASRFSQNCPVFSAPGNRPDIPMIATSVFETVSTKEVTGFGTGLGPSTLCGKGGFRS